MTQLSLFGRPIPPTPPRISFASPEHPLAWKCAGHWSGWSPVEPTTMRGVSYRERVFYRSVWCGCARRADAA